MQLRATSPNKDQLKNLLPDIIRLTLLLGDSEYHLQAPATGHPGGPMRYYANLIPQLLLYETLIILLSGLAVIFILPVAAQKNIHLSSPDNNLVFSFQLVNKSPQS